MSITGEAGGEPMKVGVAVVDVLTGLHACAGILAALYKAEGEKIEVSLLDSGLAALVNVAQNTLITGEEPQRHGNAHPNIVPYETVRGERRTGWPSPPRTTACSSASARCSKRRSWRRTTASRPTRTAWRTGNC